MWWPAGVMFEPMCSLTPSEPHLSIYFLPGVVVSEITPLFQLRVQTSKGRDPVLTFLGKHRISPKFHLYSLDKTRFWVCIPCSVTMKPCLGFRGPISFLWRSVGRLYSETTCSWSRTRRNTSILSLLPLREIKMCLITFFKVVRVSKQHKSWSYLGKISRKDTRGPSPPHPSNPCPFFWERLLLLD